MSRIGKMPIKIPSGVTVTIEPKQITVNGPKGSLSQFTMPGVAIKQEGEELLGSRSNDEAINRARHGLMRSLVNNMVEGISNGFQKKLELNGVGYRVALAGSDL